MTTGSHSTLPHTAEDEHAIVSDSICYRRSNWQVLMDVFLNTASCLLRRFVLYLLTVGRKNEVGSLQDEVCYFAFDNSPTVDDIIFPKF